MKHNFDPNTLKYAVGTLGVFETRYA